MIVEGEDAAILATAEAIVDGIIAKMDEVVPMEPIYRRSIKWKIVPERSKLMLDFVFADNPDEAADRARERLGLEPDEDFEIHRIYESSGVTGSAIKGVKHTYGTV